MDLPFAAIFGCLVAVRLVAAAYINISDCDETYNFWEPTHNLAFGGGMQTWEYSPSYALRSYLYVLEHALLARIAATLFQSRVTVFYLIRAMLGVKSSFCDAMLIWTASESYGRSVGRWTFWVALSSAGMFHASVSYLPSSFAMYCTALCWAFWARGQTRAAVLMVALAAILGWPFAALIGVPLAVHICLDPDAGPVALLRHALTAAGVVLPPVVVADCVMYRRPVLSTLNVLVYNMRPTGNGSQLYGTEPWHFYLRNLMLNFNAFFLLALASPAVMLLAPQHVAPMPSSSARRLQLKVAAFLIWLSFFCAIPHKEERFMFVAYPPLCLCAAVSADAATRTGSALMRNAGLRISPRAFVIALAALTAAVSASRVAAIVAYYRAPMVIFAHLALPAGLPPLPEGVRTTPVPRAAGTMCTAPRRLCLAGEWHRFPSSFFLPPGEVCMSFVRSSFRGQLPQPFAIVNSTFTVPDNMNDVNRDEPSRYVPLLACHYLVELERPDDPERPSAQKDWEIVYELPFLDAERSPTLTRTLWLPHLSARHNRYSSYVLLRRVR